MFQRGCCTSMCRYVRVRTLDSFLTCVLTHVLVLAVLRDMPGRFSCRGRAMRNKVAISKTKLSVAQLKEKCGKKSGDEGVHSTDDVCDQKSHGQIEREAKSRN